MRIGLTGGHGFTGSYVQSELARRGLDCVLLEADLTDPAAVAAEIEAETFDRLIHLAGEAFAESGEWRRFYEVNLLGSLTLLQAVAAKHAGTRCILAGSAQVYGDNASGSVTEEQPPQPNSHYACSKLAMEQAARTFGGRLEIVTTRPFNYTGVGQQVRYVIPKIVDHFRRRADRIELGNVDVRRDFGDVRSVAEAYVGLALADAPPPVLNIGTGHAASIRGIVEIASDLTGHRPAIEINPDFVRPNDVPLLVGDCSRLRRILPEWRPREIEETLSWMLCS